MNAYHRLAEALGLKQETVKDLSVSGWVLKGESNEPLKFVQPIPKMKTLEQNVFEEKQ